MAKAAQGEAFARLRALEPETLYEIETKLQAGDSAMAVARFIREEIGQLLDVKEDTLKKMLDRYRKGPLREKVVTQAIEATRCDTLPMAVGRINALSELENLTRIQKGRFEMALQTEQNVKLPLKSVTHEAKTLESMLVNLGKLQMETGFLLRVPRTITGSVTDAATGETKQFVWTEAQDALYGELQRTIEHEAA